MQRSAPQSRNTLQRYQRHVYVLHEESKQTNISISRVSKQV